LAVGSDEVAGEAAPESRVRVELCAGAAIRRDHLRGGGVGRPWLPRTGASKVRAWFVLVPFLIPSGEPGDVVELRMSGW
jgi:hypothetical protein